MCTLTFFPLKSTGFILTSNRDETPKRQPQELFYDSVKKILYPKEPSHGGTWICVSEKNQVLCLLNGAFVKHKHEPPYRKSRGLVLLDFFEKKCIEDFIDNYEFTGIEPFTLIVIENGNLYDLKWDGYELHKKVLDSTKAHIWSSSTLYPDDVKSLRENWFKEWISEDFDNEAQHLWNFHEKAGNGDNENGLLINRLDGKLCTVSSTQIIKNSNQIQMQYFDRMSGEKILKSVQFDVLE